MSISLKQKLQTLANLALLQWAEHTIAEMGFGINLFA